MTTHTKALLDEAVADVMPRVADPSAAIVRRAIVQRRRSTWAVASITAVAVFAALAAVKVALPTDKAPPAVGASPSTPKVEVSRKPLDVKADGNALHLNTLVLPLTDGWKYQRYDGSAVDYCSIPPQTIAYAVHGVAPGDCNAQPGVEVGPDRGLPPNGVPVAVRNLRGINEVVLPGGQPVWLSDNSAGDFAAADKSGFLAMDFNAPWAQVGVYVEMPPALESGFFGGVRSEPVAPARLSVPDGANGVYVVIDRQLVSSTAPATITEVTNRLKALDQPVDPSQPVCPGGRQVGPVWQLAAEHMAEVIFTGPDPTYPADRILATIAVSTSPTCTFATSSFSGRVWVPTGFATQIRDLVTSGR
jgi:hypothetical protein